MRRSIAISLAAVAFACEPSTSNMNIATKTRVYANARVLNLLIGAAPDAGSGTGLETFISVENDLPTTFASFPAPGVTPFTPTAIGSWTAYLSFGEAAIANSAAQTATEGQRFTVVETGTLGETSAAPQLQWVAETTPTVPADQAEVRFVLGAPAAAGAAVALGSTTLVDSAALGAMTDWTPVATSATTLTVTLGGTTTTFPVPALSAGQLHTYALAQASADSLALVDISETPGGDGTASAPIPPS